MRPVIVTVTVLSADSPALLERGAEWEWRIEGDGLPEPMLGWAGSFRAAWEGAARRLADAAEEAARQEASPPVRKPR